MAAATLIGSRCGTNLEPHLDRLAHHYPLALPAGGAAKAIESTRRPGDRAMAMLAYDPTLRAGVARA